MRQKINISSLDKQIVDFFELKKDITKENLLREIINKSGSIISSWVKYRSVFYSNGSSKIDDIINIIHSKLLEICFAFDNTKGIPFSNYFYKIIKLNILNEFGKTKTRQQKFDNQLTWYSENILEKINSSSYYTYSDERYQEVKRDIEKFFNSLNYKEITYLKNRNTSNFFYSSNKINNMLNNLRSKAEKFFK